MRQNICGSGQHSGSRLQLFHQLTHLRQVAHEDINIRKEDFLNKRIHLKYYVRFLILDGRWWEDVILWHNEVWLLQCKKKKNNWVFLIFFYIYDDLRLRILFWKSWEKASGIIPIWSVKLGALNRNSCLHVSMQTDRLSSPSSPGWCGTGVLFRGTEMKTFLHSWLIHASR